MKYLVTGGAGFIGSNLVDRLISQGHDVEVWDAFTTGKRNNVNPAAKLRVLRVEEACKQDVTQAFDVIFHLAAEARIQPSFTNPLLTHDSNVTGTISVLEIAAQHKSRVVFAGSSSVYHDMYANPYSFSKQIGEHYLRLYNKIYSVPVAIARFFNVYGPRQLQEGAYSTVIGIFEKQYKEGVPLTITGDGEQRRDFTHVDDIVSGLIAMSKNSYNCEIFNLGTGTNHSINELAKLFNHPFVYIPKRPGEAQVTMADLTLSERLLGYKPTVALEAYVASIL